ncbi:transcription initiation factor TFIIB [Pseudohyphozyma bogoriensis]|nr:transcription initiation factor TFIIB [Pseudohyphozyma bogoriensis]
MSGAPGIPFALRADPTRPAKEEAFRADLNVRLVCPDCQDDQVQLVEEFGSGDLVCGGCGLVLGDKIVDTRSEWRSFADSEGDDPSRVGGPVDPLMDAADQFSTIISFKDGHSGASRALQSAASRMTKSVIPGGRNLTEAFKTIGTMCEAISLPKTIVDMTRQLFKRVDEERLLKGKDQDAIIAACIFIACRQGRVPRTFKEIVKLTNVPKKDIAACFKLLERTFETAPVLPSSGALIPRYCNHLGLPMFIQTACQHVVDQVGEEGSLAGRNPITIASACILFTVTLFAYKGKGSNVVDIAGVAGVQDGTIRNGYRILLGSKENLVDQKWFEETRPEGQRADWANL